MLKTEVIEMKRISLYTFAGCVGFWYMAKFIIEAWVYYTSSSSDVKTIFMDATPAGGNDLVFDMNASAVGIRADKSGAK